VVFEEQSLAILALKVGVVFKLPVLALLMACMMGPAKPLVI
jgi:hypothetical protein